MILHIAQLIGMQPYRRKRRSDGWLVIYMTPSRYGSGCSAGVNAWRERERRLEMTLSLKQSTNGGFVAHGNRLVNLASRECTRPGLF